MSRWLRSRDNPGLTHVKGPNGEPLAKQAAVEEIKNFWIDFWNDVQARSPPNDQITDHLLQTAVAPPPVPWVAPTPMQLLKQANFAKGAPGADGWTGSEVASLPVEAWSTFHALSQRWLRSGQLPQAILGARTVFLAKAGKQQNGMVKAGDTRPITVLSCFWRTWLSAWLKTGPMENWIQSTLHPAVTYGKGASAEKSAAKILESYVRKHYMASLDYTKCFDSLRVNSTAALLRQLGFHNGLTTLCEQMWTNHARWCTYNAYTSETPLTPAGMGVPQGDPCGPLMTALWLSCAQRHIEALHQNFDGETSIYIDDRSFTAASATQLVERIDHWRTWSLQAGLIESDKAQATARGRPAMRALQAIGEEPMIKPDVTFLGIVTRSLQRGNAPKEEDRMALAFRRLALLRLLHVNASKYASYARLFALSCCCYGWLARHPTQTLTMKLWATVKTGQGVNRQAHKWLRCLPYGAKNHLDCLAGCNLVRVVMQLLKDGPLRWHKDAGAPVATLRKWMSDHHWTETAHWTWKHESLVVNLNDPNGDVNDVLHKVRSGWQLSCFDKFLHSKRHEVAVVQHVTSAQLLNVDWEGLRTLADNSPAIRTVLTGATVSPAWMGLPCPFCGGPGHWEHLAWECQNSPLIEERPTYDTTPIERRFGWASTSSTIIYLGKVQQLIWRQRGLRCGGGGGSGYGGRGS